MDPLSHVALGRLLIEPLSARLGRGAIGACVLGSLSPDVDLVIAPRGWDVYLRAHQAGTHALVGSILCGLAAGSLVGATSRRDIRSLAAAGAVGSVGHVALDLIAGADIRPFWPAFNRPLPWPLFAMADPWLFALLLLSAFLVAAMAPRRLIAVSLTLLIGLIGAKGVMHRIASRIGERADSQASIVHVEAVWGSLTHWIRYEADPRFVEQSDINVPAGSTTLLARVARNLNDPLVARSVSLDTVRNLLASHDITFGYAARRRDGGFDVFWSDLRYCAAMPSRGVAYQISDLRCGLWFGGEYDERSRARTAVMQVGPVVQRRTPSIPDSTQQ